MIWYDGIRGVGGAFIADVEIRTDSSEGYFSHIHYTIMQEEGLFQRNFCVNYSMLYLYLKKYL